MNENNIETDNTEASANLQAEAIMNGSMHKVMELALLTGKDYTITAKFVIHLAESERIGDLLAAIEAMTPSLDSKLLAARQRLEMELQYLRMMR